MKTTIDTQHQLLTLLDENQFREWLASQPPQKVVGYARSCKHCPIASYLTSKGLKEVEVESNLVECIKPDPDESISIRLYTFPRLKEDPELPDWVSDFVEYVDIKMRNPVLDKLPVTAAEAIADLEGWDYRRLLPPGSYTEMYERVVAKLHDKSV